MSKKILLIYHFEDNDGVGSAALLLYYMMTEMNKQREDFELLPSNYNSLAELMKRDDLSEYLSGFSGCIMTDISPNDPKKMPIFREIFGDKFVWVDHHKPIIDASHTMGFDDVSGLRDTGHSAFKNMWRYLYNIPDDVKDNECPAILKRLSGWDSFTFATENLAKDECKHVNLGVTKTLKLDIDRFLDVMPLIISPIETSSVTEIMNEYREIGRSVSSELDAINKNMIEVGGDDTWTVSDENHKAVMVVMSGGSGSETFKSVRDVTRHGIALKRMKNGNWTLSLYNVDDTDTFHCGDYLREHYNGGGHMGAAGCTLSEDQFIEVLKNRHI